MVISGNDATADLRRARDKRLAAGIVTSLAAKAASVFVPLVLIPVALQYMGATSYAVYLAAAALTAMVVFADFGLGQGLMTVVAPMLVDGRTSDARRVISTTYVLLVGVAGTLVLLVLASASVMNWAHVLGVEEATSSEARIAVVCLLGLAVNVPLSLIVRVQYAAQKVSLANAWQAVGAALSLLLAGLSVALDLGAVAVTVGIVAGPLLASGLASVWFYWSNPELRPFVVRPSVADVRALSVMGTGFFVLSIVIVVGSNLDVVLVSHFEAAAAVVAFGVVTRVFTQVGGLMSLLNAPLWPINGEALARGDLDWVKRNTTRMTIISTLATAAASVLILIAGGRLFDLWTGVPLDLSRWLLVGCAVWWTALSALSPRFMVQNSQGVIRPQLVGWAAFLVISLPIKISVLLGPGMQFVPLAASAVLVFTVVPGCIVGYRRALSLAAQGEEQGSPDLGPAMLAGPGR